MPVTSSPAMVSSTNRSSDSSVSSSVLSIGGSALLTETHTATERGEVQGINDFAIVSLDALGSALFGALLHSLGRMTLNALAVPLVAITLLATIWLTLSPYRRTAGEPAGTAGA